MATETIETVTVMSETLTVSLLVWRRFQKPMPGLVERVYALNPGLSLSGVFMPLGAEVKIPIPAAATGKTEVTPVRLWG